MSRSNSNSSSALAEIERRIREQTRSLRVRLHEDPSYSPLLWVIADQLACAQRPLRDHPQCGASGRPLPAHAGPLVLSWVKTVRAAGVRSVICLLHPKELRYYAELNGVPGLLELYARSEFAVRHIPWADPAHARTREARQQLLERVDQIKIEALAAFRNLPKPVLLQCSAGIDRSPPVAAYIVENHLRRARCPTNQWS